jgi:hypothetical protein
MAGVFEIMGETLRVVFNAMYLRRALHIEDQCIAILRSREGERMSRDEEDGGLLFGDRVADL